MTVGHPPTGSPNDHLEFAGWDVLIADAQRVRGLAPLPAKTDKIDARVLAELTPPGAGARDLAADARGARRAGASPVPKETGLSAETMGSPITTTVGPLLAFAVGASVPLVPYLLLAGTMAFALSIAGTLAALFLVGLGVSRLTHRQPVRSGLRQAAFGLLAAGLTYGVGTLLGTAVHRWRGVARGRARRKTDGRAWTERWRPANVSRGAGSR